MPSQIERLNCTLKNYAWGKLGENSEVARLFVEGHEDEEINSDTPYAELWIGTHPDGPSRIHLSNVQLSEILTDKNKKKNIQLPFIMKIMSIRHTLSLQVHPTKEQAILLNKQDPINYPDQNHKPELAYALTRFELLCGFRPMGEILENMKAFPELCQAMGYQNTKAFIELSKQYSPDSFEMINALRKCFTTMINFKKESVNKLITNLIKRINNGVYGCLNINTIKIIKDMFQRFPNDIGCLCPIYLNHIILEPGECVYYGAQELHAYLSGECVECVSCSNNTIRAGLTNKFVDKENLIKVLNYRMTDPEYYFVNPQSVSGYPHVLEYAPNCRDFTLHAIEINFKTKNDNEQFKFDLPTLECSSTFILTEGENINCIELNSKKCFLKQFMAKRGYIFYIPPMHTLRFISNSGLYLKGFRTFSFEEGPDHSKRIMFNANEKIKSNIILNNDTSIKQTPKTKLMLNPSINIFDIETEMDGFL
ncbi:hypothetical protein ACQ4LE_009787 [Meloidogyne hapla]|uniref:mannose-6-phosphate isomerase n=1 Tax=Meloidogyne hapla TaxID=6305 RepID=A0A1I8C212_MELHA